MAAGALRCAAKKLERLNVFRSIPAFKQSKIPEMLVHACVIMAEYCFVVEC